MTKTTSPKWKPQRTTSNARKAQKASQAAAASAANALQAKLHPSHQRIAEFMNPLPVALQKICVGKLRAASQAGSTYQDDPQEPNRIVRIVSQSLGDILNNHSPVDRAALLQQIVDDYGTPDLPSARERALLAKQNRSSRRRRRF